MDFKFHPEYNHLSFTDLQEAALRWHGEKYFTRLLSEELPPNVELSTRELRAAMAENREKALEAHIIIYGTPANSLKFTTEQYTTHLGIEYNITPPTNHTVSSNGILSNITRFIRSRCL
jgi:hypothetical protein